MKDIFELRPALPRYQTTWDISKVLDFLSKAAYAFTVDFKIP